jgi:aspartyl protease family protein
MAKDRNRLHRQIRMSAACAPDLRILAFLLFTLPAVVSATEVSVIGLFPGKAVVVIDGGPPRTLSAGQKAVQGVTLISSDRESATLNIDGQKRTLKIGQHHAGPAAASSAQSTTLTADPSGHFVVDGQINGGSVRFLVDTGATSVALSSADAVRLGIDYRKGQPALMSTANGAAAAYRLRLDTVRVGDIVLNNVDAAVLEGSHMPFALLGMSFLNRMEMKREGQTMVLIRRF